ncbi:DNA polymerase domain-containing protein [Saliphagus infecundisoli]|uniref:DNA polymerase n=1 Tax=Saliphagus infecundisoli TaxID=1849069 RepID=A0ABD5QKN8_9EURY|nr:DNA polymerase domain-containing protein [Saliphagus infecundisoli]
MSEEAQTGLGDYAGEVDDGSGDEGGEVTGSGDRLVEEAIAVAGNGGSSRAEVVDVVAEALPEPQGALELAVMQVDYTIAGRGDDERPVMHVFGRTRDGEIEHVRVVGFRPYFYAPTASLEGPPEERYDRLTGSETEDAEGEPYESIRGERLTKIFGQTPRDVGQVRDEFDHYEADILFPNRFLIDKDVRSGIRVPERRADDDSLVVPHDEVEACEVEAAPRVCTFDIEVDDRSGFPEDGEEPIVCLTSHDSGRDEYVMWLYEAPIGEGPIPDEITAYEPIEGRIDHEIRTFAEEEAMLEAFIDYVSEDTDPDVITGWNCLPADIDVLMADGTEKEIRNVEIGDNVVGSDSQRTTVTEVTNKWQSEKSIRELSLADGTSLRSSDDHRIMVGDDDSVGWKAGSEIESGDYVLKPRRLPLEETYVPTLADLVPRERQRYAEKQTISEFKEELPYGAVSELADAFDASVETLYHPHTTVWTPSRCRKAADQYEIPVPDGGVEYHGTGVDLDRELTPEELYYAGLILTDGSISPEDGIRFYNTKKELHYRFPGENHLEPDGTGCYKQNVLDYATMYAFNGLGIPFGDKNDDDVDLSTVYELPTEYIGRFLAGALDGDGSVARSGITIAAENRSIGEWYVKLFKRLGIYAQQRENVVRVPDAKRDVDRLTDHVLPHMGHREKKAALEAFEGGKSGQTENIPYALFEADVGTDAKQIGNDKHRRGINLKRHETSLDAWEEYVFVEVTNISVTGTETTYDIETTTHNFVAEGCLVHNCDDFDAPYLLDRLERLQGPHHDYDLDIDRLSRVDEVWRSNWGGPDIKGRVVFDLLYGYQRMVISELDSYRLDAVGEAELGVGKERYAGDIGDLWEDDPTQLLEYNLRDVELCVELDRQQNIVPFWDEVRAFVGCKLEDAPTPGDAVDMYVLHEAYGRFALPSKGQQDAGEEYEGGAVFDPITGVKENVTVLDLKSLYPMCMVTVNASPETRVDPESYDGATHTAPTTPEPTHFRQEPDGIIREMVNELLAEREEKKELRNAHNPGSPKFEQYDRQQGAVKVIMNSLYGVSGWEQFRLYDKDAASAITATGREVIEFTEEAANELNYQVSYGDTDSVMLELGPEVTKEEAIEQSFDIEEHINERYDHFARDVLNAEDHRFQIEFEKLYRRFFQAGKKKRYAGHITWKEGKDVDTIDIVGFEYQRSDIAPITKEVQHRVIEMIVKEGDVEGAKEYLHGVIEEVRTGEISVEEIGIPGGIGKRLDDYDTDTAQVRGAKYANRLLGTNFQRGSKPKRLYLKRVDPAFFRRVEDERELDARTDPLYRAFKRDPDVICFEYADQLPEEFEVDDDKMLEKTLKGPIARILEALGISWEEVKSGQEQTGLDSFV